MFSSELHRKLVQEYPEDYCSLLEEHYGFGMMSEGGAEGIELMFKGVDLKNKKALDIGSGMGGVPEYLAKTHNMDVTGLEINPWMVEETTKRIPKHLESQLRYVLSISDDTLNFPDNHFDIVYSKGVLVHLKNKNGLFKEIRRVLKSGGVLVIDDWIAPKDGQWGDEIQRMMEIENLSLFAQSQESYIKDLQDAGFNVTSVKDDSKFYADYNRKICFDLEGPKKEKFLELLGQKGYQENLAGYRMIAESFENQELYSITFVVE